MGYRLTKKGLNAVLTDLSRQYKLYAPHRYVNQGEFSDTDSIRYGEIKTADDMELLEKSSHTFKEALIPISETLFFFTEDNIKESERIHTGAVIFLRSCDLHAVKRLDEMSQPVLVIVFALMPVMILRLLQSELKKQFSLTTYILKLH
jgi:anaerobic sulfite reductase subunit A